jgi:pimeloyl-ACP methyl ester carboxylesterase
VSTAVATQTIAANGLVFTADIGGPADGGLVLFLHGFPHSRHSWRAELVAVAAAGYRVCAPDQRGYSPGARPEGIDAYRTDQLVNDALALADELGAEHFHVVGHDWGGQLAWYLGALHPHRVRSVAVISRPHPATFVKAMNADSSQSVRSGHHRSFQRAEATSELLADDAAGLRTILSDWAVPAADAAEYLSLLNSRGALDAAINWYRAVRLSEVLPGEFTGPLLEHLESLSIGEG